VARNHINPEDWEDRTPILDAPQEKIRVGWAGSHQHIWDLRLAAPALHLAKELGAEIVLIGLDPAMHDKKWKEFLGEYTHIPWSTPEAYHRHYLNLDIGIAPLVMNAHTLGKSDVKFLEYSMSGAATVAQNNPVYNKTIVHGETGLLAGSPDEMAFAVAELIQHKKLRRDLAAAAKQYVLEERTIQGNVHEWLDPIGGVRMVA
jgi:glycosyltransferase involved in cell wall biosynthesis